MSFLKWILIPFLAMMGPCQPAAFAQYTPKAKQVSVDTTNFGRNLTSADSNVQHALDTLDDLVASGGGTWGSITGTLSSQTDLQTALNAKQATITTGTTAQYLRGDLSLATFPTNLSSFTNGPGYITGIAWGGITGTLSNQTDLQTALNAKFTTANAVADGSTKGIASFTANDFDASSGNISLDYTNGQKATNSVPGFMTAADHTTLSGIVSSQWTTVGSNINRGSGNVGIGSTAPGQALDVQGTVRANFFKGNGSQLTNIPAGGTNQQIQYNNSGSLGGLGSWDGDTLTLPGNVNMSGGAIIAGDNSLSSNQLQFSSGIGPVYFGAFGGPSSSPMIGFSIPFNVVMGISAGSPRIGFGGGTAYAFTVPDSTVEIIKTEDDIHIFNVNSGSGSNGDLFNIDSGGGVNASNTVTVGNLVDNGMSTNSIVHTDISGQLSAASSADIIGLFSTCSGTQYLGADGSCHSVGGASAAGGTNAVQYNSGSSTFAGAENVFSFNGTNIGIGTTNGTNKLDIRGSLTTKALQVTSAGNVGIGSTNPGQALDVNGTVRSTAFIKTSGTSSQFLKADGSVDSSTYLTGNQTITLSSDVTGSGTTAITASLKSTGTAGTYRSTTFDAQGRETSGTNPTTFSGYGISDTSANLATAITDETGSGALVFATSPNFTANVGIGSTAPGAALDVNGTVRAVGLNGTFFPTTNTTASSTTPSINSDSTSFYSITALAGNITTWTITGTPKDGQKLELRIKDNGTARTIAWPGTIVTRGGTLPTTTVISKYLRIALEWNSQASTWDCVSAIQEP